MKNGQVIKSASGNIISNQDLELINKYTIKPLAKEDVEIFNVTLCDNDIDRDYECFSVEALNQLAKLFVGKPGIMDHSLKTEDQIARIFSCEVKKSENQKNTLGEPYYSLVAKAYVIKSEKNNALISDIAGGIKKEVSVNCGIREKICSVCGKNYEDCSHRAGVVYKVNDIEKICYVTLNNPIDAYEWSFVAVPAQKNAGVIKHFQKITSNCEKDNSQVVLSSKEATAVSNAMDELKALAQYGENYKEELQKSFMKSAFSSLPDLDRCVVSSMSEKLSIKELKCLSKALGELSIKKSASKPQLFHSNAVKNENLQQFKI